MAEQPIHIVEHKNVRACRGCAQPVGKPHKASCPEVKPPPPGEKEQGMPWVRDSECETWSGPVTRKVTPSKLRREEEAREKAAEEEARALAEGRRGWGT